MYINIIRNRLSNVYITPPTRFLMLKSSIMTSNMSHSGEIPAKAHQLAYISFQSSNTYLQKRGWSGGAKVLGHLSVPGRPTNFDNSRTRTYCACSRCGWGWFGHFSLVYHFSLLSPPLWETVRYRLKYCLKGPLNPKQPTNQPAEKQLSNGVMKVFFSISKTKSGPFSTGSRLL